jgi:two-component system cell cycle sensor histidine kinase/response regulator CckA
MMQRALGGDSASGRPARVTFRLRPVVLTSKLAAFPQQVPPGDYLCVQVQDGGVGMAPEVLTQALDPFFTTKEVGQGTGLGLPMVFGIVQGHQGFLTIDSEPGGGTCVGLYLPRMIDRPPAAQSPIVFGDAEVVEPEHSPGQAILVIDDEEAVLDVVRRFLEIAGHRVVCATSGQEGVDHLVGGRSFDLVILDLMMPREDAVATFQRIRQHCPRAPVLLCTGLAEAEPAPRLLRQPATALIRKPFRMNELWYAVRQAMAPPAQA